jgi:lysozyme family protein
LFEEILRKILDIEGGYSNDPDDVGGETICGIARNFWPNWEGWKYVDETKDNGEVPQVERFIPLAEKFYRQMFWDPIRGDDLVNHDVAYEMFDIAVNLGTHRARTFLQEALNLLNRDGKSWDEILEDGRLGSRSMATLQKALGQRNGSRDLCKVLNALQAMHYINRVRAKSSQEKFLRGWLDRT